MDIITNPRLLLKEEPNINATPFVGLYEINCYTFEELKFIADVWYRPRGDGDHARTATTKKFGRSWQARLVTKPILNQSSWLIKDLTFVRFGLESIKALSVYPL